MSTRARIAVVGSANIDLTTFSDSFPRAGETLFGKRFALSFGGKGANQAVAARLCGADVLMIAKVGDDLFGEATIKNLESFGIDTRHVHVVGGVATGVAAIFVEPSGQNRIIVIKGANDLLMPADVDAAAAQLRDVDTIILQLEIPLETVYHTIHFASAHNICCILNPAPAVPLNLNDLTAVNYCVPNETEAGAIAGLPIDSVGDAALCARALLDKGSRRVVVTLGARGSLLADSEGTVHIPAFPVSAVDTTGAGDAFIGSFAAFLGEGLLEKEALARANLFAALSTTAAGAQKSFPSRIDFEAEWHRRCETH